ncbi:MAG: hypothetical protein DMF69_01095 [Acidobacteria bacterium]|nr:MAG: hypothetical protein DMF69_01095 [Acidobacteriota bacterium]
MVSQHVRRTPVYRSFTWPPSRQTKSSSDTRNAHFPHSLPTYIGSYIRPTLLAISHVHDAVLSIHSLEPSCFDCKVQTGILRLSLSFSAQRVPRKRIPMYSKFKSHRVIVVLTLIYAVTFLTTVGNKAKQSHKLNPHVNPNALTLSGKEAINQLKRQGTYASLEAAMMADLTAPWQQQMHLQAQDGTAFDYFGWSVAISGDTAIVGAHEDDEGGTFQGSAYIFVRNGAEWTQQQKLTVNEDGFSGDRFGFSVAISGNTVVVGSPLVDLDNNTNGVNEDQGAAYVFVRNGVTWLQQERLTANDGGLRHNFGRSVSISGNTAVVGTQAARAYIFERNGTTWSQKNLTANLQPGSSFGSFVAISGDTALVQANDLADFNPAEGPEGSVYVFVRNGDQWTIQQKLTTTDFQTGDAFASSSLAISGDTAVIAYTNLGYSCRAIGENCNTEHLPDETRQGAYVFVRNNGIWAQETKLVPPYGIRAGTFPKVAVSGDNAIVGFDGGVVGSAFVYNREDGSWLNQQTLSGRHVGAFDGFGFSVGISGSTAIVGAVTDDVGPNPQSDLGANVNQGSAFIFLSSPDTDGDAIPDDWERNGVSIDGAFIDLPAMGANPKHKDIFVHVDWMVPAPNGVVYKPDPRAIKTVTDSFAISPVTNPDNKTGINLHVDVGDDSLMNAADPKKTWGALSRSGPVPYQQTIGILDDSGYSWTEVDIVKALHFESSQRSPIFHYALFCNSIGGPYSGLSRKAPGPDFLIALEGAARPVEQVAGTFMHELGHNLGLAHGGVDSVNYKPNYLSVMNYQFQAPGVLKPNGKQRIVDYSRFALPTLNENNLIESLGIIDPFGHPTFWNSVSNLNNPPGSNKCVEHPNLYNKVFLPPALDWNCDGLLTVAPVKADLNGDSICVKSGPDFTLETVPGGDDLVADVAIVDGPNRKCETTAAATDKQIFSDYEIQPITLIGFNDWANLHYGGGGRIGAMGVGDSDEILTAVKEATFEELRDGLPPYLLEEGLVAPRDEVTLSEQNGSAPLTVNFDGSGSTAVTGSIVEWAWDFGDGTTGSGAIVAHTYTTPDTYFASLTVTDSSGRVNLIPLLHRITVEDSPSPTPTPTPTPELKPNLTPHQLAGWSNKLVVSNTTGTNTDASSLLSSDLLYVDLAIINNGDSATSTSFQAKLYIDGSEVHSFNVSPPLNVLDYTYLLDLPVGPLNAGQHTIKIVVDTNGEISESDETDNEYTRLIDVASGGPPTANFISRQNGEWSNPCTWNAPDSNGNCGSRLPGQTPSDDVEILHAVTTPGGGGCRDLKLSGSVAGNPISITGNLQILGGTVNANITVGGSTNVIGGGALHKVLTTKGITVGGTLAGSGFIFVVSNSANPVVFTNNGVVTLEGIRFGTDGQAFTYTVAGNGTWNINQWIELRAINTLEIAGSQQMNSTLSIPPGSRVIVSGALTSGSGDIGNNGTIVISGSWTFNGRSIQNAGTLDVGNTTLNFNGTEFFGTGGGGGVVIGTGNIRFAPSDGSAVLAVNGVIGPAVTIAAGTIVYQSGLSSSNTGGVFGPFVVDPGAVFSMTASALYAHGDVTINGAVTKAGPPSDTAIINFNGSTFTNNGSIGNIDFLNFNVINAPKSQFIAGTGTWGATNVGVGGNTPSTANVTLLSDVTFTLNQLAVRSGSTLNVGSHTLTLNNPTILKIQSTGIANIGGPFTPVIIDPLLEIAAGTVKGTGITANGGLTIDAGATFSLYGSFGMRAYGNVTNNGTLNTFSDAPGLQFFGTNWTNNGAIAGALGIGFGTSIIAGPPVSQSLAGIGSWANPTLFKRRDAVP